MCRKYVSFSIDSISCSPEVKVKESESIKQSRVPRICISFLSNTLSECSPSGVIAQINTLNLMTKIHSGCVTHLVKNLFELLSHRIHRSMYGEGGGYVMPVGVFTPSC